MKKNSNHRIVSLDILRGIAVILMVLAHTISFTYKGSSGALLLIRDIGNTLCFTIFLFTSGASTYLAYISTSRNKWKQKKKRLAKRLFVLLIGYYLVAIISSLEKLSSPENIVRILLFLNVPGYTEFLLPFIFFGIVTLAARALFAKIVKNPIILLTISVLFFALGSALSQITFSGTAGEIMSLFAGGAGLFRFPILQYTPVFAAGIFFGSALNKDKSTAVNTGIMLAAGFFALSALHILSLHIPNITTFERWPPSIPFIATGLAVSLVLLIFVELLPGLEKKLEVLAVMGKTAFGIYIWHDIILQTNAKVFELKFAGIWQVILAFMLILGSSFGIVTLSRTIRLKLHKKQ